MLLDPLTKCIEQLQARIKAHGASLGQNELRTRIALIDPLLRILGWEVSDPDCVTPEYQINKKFVDYALMGPHGKPAAILEAKKLGEPLTDHRMQMLNYANMNGISYAGLTNGDRWELYDVFRRGTLEERKILNVSIKSDPLHKNALALLCLWRSNIRSGQVVRPVRPIFPPNDDTIIDPNGVSIGSYPSPTGKPCPTSLRLWDGKDRRLNYWYDILIEIVERLHADGLLTEADMPFTPSPKSRRFLINAEPIHRDGTPFRQPKQPIGTPLHVEVWHSSANILKYAKSLLSKFGKDPSTDALLSKS